jgi:hypothetical protein
VIGEELVISMSMTEKLFSNIPNSSMRGGCYRKTAHPRNADEAQGYEYTEVADTLNIFDNSEGRTPILIVEVVNGRSEDNRESS